MKGTYITKPHGYYLITEVENSINEGTQVQIDIALNSNDSLAIALDATEDLQNGLLSIYEAIVNGEIAEATERAHQYNTAYKECVYTITAFAEGMALARKYPPKAEEWEIEWVLEYDNPFNPTGYDTYTEAITHLDNVIAGLETLESTKDSQTAIDNIISACGIMGVILN